VGRAEIAGLVAAGHAVEPVEASFDLTASRAPDGRWAGQVRIPRVRSDRVAAHDLMASLAVDGRRIELTRAQARVAAVPVEASGVWDWAGSGRGRAAIGPVALGAITGVPSSLRLGGTGRVTVEASFERGVALATALADLGQVSATGVALGDGRAEVRVRGEALEGELSFPARRLRVTAAGQLNAGATLATRLELDDVALPPLLRELGSGAADHVDGRLSVRGEASVPLGQPSGGRGIVRVTPDGLRLLGEPWTSRGPIVLRWEGPRLAVERFRLDGAAGSLTVAGAITSADNQALSLALDNARLPGALAGLGRGTVRADVRLGGEALELSRLDARWPGLTATASGRARADGAVELGGRADADLAGLAPALGIPGLGGRATLLADARRRDGVIEAAGSLRAPRIALPDAALSGLEVPFRVSGSTLRVERAQATLGASRISADASATWPAARPVTAESLARDAQLRADIRAPAARLEDLCPLLPSALRGRGLIALTARGEGTLGNWRGGGTLTAPLLELGAGSLRQMRATFALDRTRVEVTDLRVDAIGVPIRAAAAWNWAGGGSAKATLGPVALDGLAVVPAGVGLRGTGQATIEASMRSPADLSGTAHAALTDVGVGGVSLGRGVIDVSSRAGALRAEVAFPERGLRATGSGRLDAGGTLSAEASAPAIDLGVLAEAIRSAPATLGGTLGARVTAQVSLAEPARGEGVLSLDPVRLVVASEAWENRGPIEVRWAQGGLSLSTFRLSGRNGLVSGAGTLGADGKLDARASAQVSLAALAAVRPEIRDLGGALDLSLRASGTLAAPSFAGDGAIHRGHLLLRDRPETLRDLEARLSLSGQGLRLIEATGSLGGGRVQAAGDLALRGWQPQAYRVRLQARNVAVAAIEGFSSAWDADLELSGLTGQAQLAGRTRLVRGLYNRELSILSLALSPSRAPAAETGPSLRLRVRVDLDDNLVVRNRAADLRAGGVLSVEGTAARPVIFGSVTSQDGHIVFRGRDWTVTSATVRFADPRRLDPYLDVHAASRIGEYDVSMQITGPVSNVVVRFSSTPRLSQNDLLSLVAFGVTGAQLSESPATVLLGETGKLLAQNVLGIDPGATGLRISTGASAGNTGELHGFPGEERTIRGPGQTTTEGKERVRVEYQLLAPLFLSGEYDREGDYGADLVLRFRFR
jgi:translocation and assembly module TamB